MGSQNSIHGILVMRGTPFPNVLEVFFFSKFPSSKPDLKCASSLPAGWCGAGADHYEPILAKQKAKSEDGEKPAIAL